MARLLLIAYCSCRVVGQEPLRISRIYTSKAKYKLMSEISLWLDSYDDIYSDFDSRHFLKRRISEDFLHELRSSKKYKREGVTDLLLFLPGEERKESSETAIINSLRDFFGNQFQISNNKYRVKRNNGIAALVAGFITMVVNSYMGFYGLHSLPFITLKVLLEPCGWFLLWLGFDFLFYDLREIKREKDFFREFSEINILFETS